MKNIFLLALLLIFSSSLKAQVVVDGGADASLTRISSLNSGYYTIKSVGTNAVFSASNYNPNIASPIVQQNDEILLTEMVFYLQKVTFGNSVYYYIYSLKQQGQVLAWDKGTSIVLRSELTDFARGNYNSDYLFALYQGTSPGWIKIKPMTTANQFIRTEYPGQPTALSLAIHNTDVFFNFLLNPVTDITNILTATSGSKAYSSLSNEYKNTLIFGDELKRGDYIVSQNGAYSLLLTKQGSLNVYRTNNPNNLSSNETPFYTYTRSGAPVYKIKMGTSSSTASAKMGVFAESGVGSNTTLNALFPNVADGVNCFLTLTDSGEVQILPGRDMNSRLAGSPIWRSNARETPPTVRLISFDLISSKVTEGGVNNMKATSVTVNNSSPLKQNAQVEFAVSEASNTTFEISNSWALDRAISMTATMGFDVQGKGSVITQKAGLSLETSFDLNFSNSTTNSNSSLKGREEVTVITVPVAVPPGTKINVILKPMMQTVVQEYSYVGMGQYANGVQRLLSGVLTISKVFPNSYSASFNPIN